MPYMRDAQGRRLDTFVPVRDLPGVLAHWDGSLLPGAVGSAVALLPDQAGNGNHLLQGTPANRPTVAVDATTGKKYLALGSAGFLSRSTLGNGDWLFPTSVAQPVSFAFVVRLPTGTSVAAARYIAGMGGINVFTGTATGSASANAGTSMSGGPSLADSTKHVIVGVVSANGSALFLDGQLVASLLTTGAGVGALAGFTLGAASSGGSSPFGGDVFEDIVASAAWTPQQIAALSAALGSKWGVTIGTAQAPPTIDPTTTSSNGQSVRIWEPPNLAADAPLVIYCHNYNGDEAVTPGAGTWIFPLVMASLAEGWRCAGSRQHSNSWANQNSLDDVADVYATMTARQSVSKVLVIGASMGAASAALLVPDGRLPVKGVYLIDPVLSLADVNDPQSGFTNYSAAINTAYAVTSGTLSAGTASGVTSIPTTASFPTIGTQLLVGRGTANAEIVTTTGASTGTAVAVTATTKVHSSGESVSDYPTKTSGHDPMLRAASDFTAVRWRFVKSTLDTSNVNGANNADAFSTKVAAAAEAAVVTHGGAHLASSSARPSSFVAFAKRCFA